MAPNSILKLDRVWTFAMIIKFIAQQAVYVLMDIILSMEYVQDALITDSLILKPDNVYVILVLILSMINVYQLAWEIK